MAINVSSSISIDERRRDERLLRRRRLLRQRRRLLLTRMSAGAYDPAGASSTKIDGV
jgi:hypothetical protein